jgi:hypothetical protein
VEDVEDVDADVLLLFLPLEVGGGVVGPGVVGLPPEADPADVDVATSVASEAVGRIFASDATRAASCTAVHALASLTFEDFFESFGMKEPSWGGLFLPPFFPIVEAVVEGMLVRLGASKMSTVVMISKNFGDSLDARILGRVYSMEIGAEEGELPVLLTEEVHKRSGQFCWSPLVQLK